MRRFVIVFLLLSLILPVTPPPGVDAQTTDADAAAQMAYDLSVLEASGDFNTLYDLIHSDAHEIIPRSAVIGWYQNEFAPMGVAPAVITGVQFVQWTWAVNGQTYPYTAEVSFEQARADGTYIVDVVRLVQDEYGTWRWFFGRSREFVDEQIALYAQPRLQPTRFDSIVEFVVADLDAYWATSFSAGRERYASPSVYSFSGSGETACGSFDWTIGPAFYCGLEQSIYVDLEYFEYYDYMIGDFAWITVMAHEWGHHVQVLNGTLNRSPLENELRADCLAGSYARDAETRGLLNEGDIYEALTISAMSGDPVGLPQDHPGAHGTGDDRVTAFMLGYLTGFIGCELDLSDGLGPSQAVPVQPSAGSLIDLLPQQRDVPSDLVLVSQQDRTLAQVAANYTDPVATERMYRDWGWQGNSTILYSGTGAQSSVTEVYVSIHQLGSRRHAGEALQFSVADQAASTGAWEVPASSGAEETRALRTNGDLTLYARQGDYLIRLTVTSWLDDPISEGIDILEEMLDNIR